MKGNRAVTRFLSLFVGGHIFWCDTQIGGFPPIFTDKTHRQLETKLVKKSADFFCPEKSADFVVGGEIVWWDTSLTHQDWKHIKEDMGSSITAFRPPLKCPKRSLNEVPPVQSKLSMRNVFSGLKILETVNLVWTSH